jgi:c-di-GMP-binding flagellar brake protein YcgR
MTSKTTNPLTENNIGDCKKEFELNTLIKLENGSESHTYNLAMVLPDKILICKSISKVVNGNIAVGSLINLINQIEENVYITPVQVMSITDYAELVAVRVMGETQVAQRRKFTRVKTGAGVQLKLQLDNYTSRYKSLEVSDISTGGVGVVIFSKNAIATGHFANLDIQLPMVGINNRLNARGQIMHCSPHNQSRMAYLLGIKFIDLPASEQKKIVEYIDHLQRQSEARTPSSNSENESKEQIVKNDGNENNSSQEVA